MAITVIKIIQIVISIVIVGLVLIQGKGGGLSGTFGGSITMYRSKRGIEKVILFATIFLSAILVANSLAIINF